jgi:hypothetical protein
MLEAERLESDYVEAELAAAAGRIAELEAELEQHVELLRGAL